MAEWNLLPMLRNAALIKTIGSFIGTRCVLCDAGSGVLARCDAGWNRICLDCAIFMSEDDSAQLTVKGASEVGQIASVPVPPSSVAPEPDASSSSAAVVQNPLVS